jgi:TatD DNase family protein
MLIDTHAHLDFYEELQPVLDAAAAANLSAILAIGIGDGPATMHRALEIARDRSTPQLRLYASAGIHPQEAHQATPEHLAKLAELAENPLCIAIGEIGLDYYHFENPDIPIQQEAFRAQMKIAAAAGKPILLHCRTSDLATPQAKARYGTASASDDMLTMLEADWAPTGLPFVLHCFSGTPADAARALVINGYLSFAGNLTYPKSTTIQQVAAEAPADRIFVETDAPFLAPIPLRGELNQPANVTHTAAFLAALRNTTPQAIATQTTANFNNCFQLSSTGSQLS